MRAATLITCAALALATPALATAENLPPPTDTHTGKCLTAAGKWKKCPPVAIVAVVAPDPGHGLWCGSALTARSDGTLGSALEEIMTDLPLASVPGRYAWYVQGVGLTCEYSDTAGRAATGRTVDQTGAVSGSPEANVYEEYANA